MHANAGARSCRKDFDSAAQVQCAFYTFSRAGRLRGRAPVGAHSRPPLRFKDAAAEKSVQSPKTPPSAARPPHLRIARRHALAVIILHGFVPLGPVEVSN